VTVAPEAGSTTASPTHGSPLGITAAIASVTVFGLGNVLIKRVPLTGLVLATDRLWLGAALYLGVVLARGGRPSIAMLRLSWRGGAAYGLHLALGFTALKLTRVSDMTIILALQPALVMLLAHRLFGERVHRSAVIGTAVAFGGVAIALSSGTSGGGSLVGDALAVGALFAWTAYFIWSKQARQVLGAFEYQLAATLVAAVVVTPLALAVDGTAVIPHRWEDVGWAALVVLGPGTGHLLLNWAHAHVEITLASMLTLGAPIAAAIGAAVFLGEPVLAVQVVGMAVALAALAWVVAASGRRVAALAAADV